MPLVFLALPVSMRRARVRWRHLGRITAYSLIWPILSVMAYEAVMLRHMDVVWGGARPLEVWSAARWLVLGVLALWWFAAVSRYLRMRHALGVALALLTIGTLAGMASETYLALALGLV